jgi:hypothetical protein
VETRNLFSFDEARFVIVGVGAADVAVVSPFLTAPG